MTHTSPVSASRALPIRLIACLTIATLTTLACISGEEPVEDENNGTPAADMGGGSTDMGGGDTDMGTPAVDMGTPAVDMGGTDMGTPVDMGGGGGGRTLSTDVEFDYPSREIADGHFIPLTAQGVKPYSFSANGFTFRTRGSDSVQITGITLEVLDGKKADNWSLRERQVLDGPPYVFEPFTLEPNMGKTLATLFRPVETGVINAKITVLIGDNQYAEGLIRGRGRDAAFISKNVEPISEIGWGHANSSSKILSGAQVVDPAGNVFISGNVNQWIDNISHDITVARINPDGTQAWARVWHEEHQQEQPDSGQNNQTGGVSRATAYGPDGHIYVVGKRSTIVQNNRFDGLMLKINPESGDMVWARALRGDQDADKSEAVIYAVDASLADRIIVTGTMNGGVAGPFIAAISKADGSIIWSRSYGTAGPDRAYTIKLNADGTGYTGGWTSAPAGFLARWSGLDGAEPKLEWARVISLPRGSLVQDLDVDPAGNVYVAYDIRGAQTFHQMSRFNKDGSTAWNMIYNARERSDRQTTGAIRFHNGKVYAGGTLSHEPYDTNGDGFLMSLNADTGAYEWVKVFYNGTTAETQTEHRVKGLDIVNGQVVVLMQQYTNARNFNHYWGYWYDNVDNNLREPWGNGDAFHQVSADANAMDITASFQVGPQENISVITIEATGTNWQQPPAAVVSTPLRDLTGNGGHWQSVISRLKITGVE